MYLHQVLLHRNRHTYTNIVSYMIRIHSTFTRSLPPLRGIRHDDGVLVFDPDHYESFIEEATGMSVTNDLSATKCYVIGNRLEAIIDEATRRGEWSRTLTDYPDISSMDEIVGLARLFRRAHAERSREISV